MFFSNTAQEAVFARADERPKILRFDGQPVSLRKHPAGGLGDERLRIAEHAIHVENNALD